MIDFAGDARGRELHLLVERAKYERHVLGLVDQLLDREFTRLVDLMLSPRYRSLTQAQRQRTLQLFREIQARLGAGYDDVATLVLREMQGYATLEADVARVQATAVLAAGAGEAAITLGPTLSRAYLASIAKLPIQGLNIGEWFDAQARTMTVETKRILQQGLVEGKGTTDIARRITADARTAGPVLSRRAKADAAAISRTTVNAVQNDAAMASYERLPASVSDSYRLLIVRDTRTSKICLGLALSGRIVYRYDDPNRKVPPLHILCRTGVQPILKGAEQSVADQKAPITMGDYATWLTAQPVTVQNDLLGVTRAGLWRSGRMRLADAIDADARVLTLKELRAKLGLDALIAK
jgi:SPP1 gp7 family putative phage head morphogenesis protein